MSHGSEKYLTPAISSYSPINPFAPLWEKNTIKSLLLLRPGMQPIEGVTLVILVYVDKYK